MAGLVPAISFCDGLKFGAERRAGLLDLLG
jgi:hypothetical protein